MTVAHPLSPRSLLEQRVAAELRRADDELMATTFALCPRTKVKRKEQGRESAAPQIQCAAANDAFDGLLPPEPSLHELFNSSGSLAMFEQWAADRRLGLPPFCYK
jgi:hypothetical protein